MSWYDSDSSSDENDINEISTVDNLDLMEKNLKKMNFSTIVPIGSDLLTVYNYLSDCRFIKPRTPSHSLDMLSSIHNILLQHLINLNNENSVPIFPLLKNYAKFRHNIFASLCRFALNQKDFMLDTDASLQSYLPECKKTPDMILENESSIFLIEFTVSNKYNVVDFHKGGGAFAVKYTQEADLIMKKFGKPCRVVIIPAVLENYNIKEISDIIKMIDPECWIMRTELDSFFEICNYNRDIININQSNSSLEQGYSPKQIQGMEYFPRPNFRNVVMLSGDILSEATKALVYLKDTMLKHIGKIKKVYLYYSIESNRFGVKLRDKGMSVDDFISNLQKNSINFLLENMKIEEYGKNVGFEKIRGTVPVSLNLDRKKLDRKINLYRPLYSDFYVNKIMLFPPDRDIPNIYSQNDLSLVIGESNKVIFPPDYFDKLCNMDTEKLCNSTNRKMLGNCKVDNEEFDKCISLFSAKMEIENSKLTIKYPKPSFMFPLCTSLITLTDFGNINKFMLMEYIKKGKGIYSIEISKRAVNEQYCKNVVDLKSLGLKIRELKDSYNQANSDYYEKLKTINLFKRYSSMTVKERNQIYKEKSILTKAQSLYSKELGKIKGSKQSRMIRINCSNKSIMKPHFKAEMIHFEKNGSEYRGVGKCNDSEMLDFQKYLHDLIERMCLVSHGFSSRSLYNRERLPGPEFLNKLKNDYTKRWDFFYNTFFKGSLIEQLCDFISKLSSHLFNESIKSYNKDFIKIDNLGFDNIVVFIRGGPKIYKHQTSRLFRVMFFVDEKDLIFTGYQENPNFEVIRTKEGAMVVTPWSQIRQDILFDGLAISQRTFLNLYSTYTRIYTDFKNEIPKMCLMPFLLSLHNKRKTEEFMHNSRYLIVNPLGLHANLSGIIESFASFNYTYLDAWLKYRIGTKYKEFGAKIAFIRRFKGGKIDNLLNDYKLDDLWLDQPILNADHLTTFIYITYMMTKAPVNSSIEQASNLWEILEDVHNFNTEHSDVEAMNDKSLRFNVLDFDEAQYEDDFKYDPVFSQYLGHYLTGYLKNITNSVEINNYWNNLKNMDVDVIANSNGLRGYNNNNFFNKKGYEIIYSKIDELLTEGTLEEKIENYLSSDLITSSEMINNDKFRRKEIVDPYQDLIFHVVHKIQRGGGREIFCMDMNTKLKQNPLEKMFKFICKKIPNEFISIPSNKRHSIIHSDFYEKGPSGWSKNIYRWVLDCRRWAPHSIFQKYVHFIEGLSPLLPPDFLNEFMDFANQMFNKKFVTRKHVMDKIMNNEKFKKYENQIEKMEKIADGYEMVVKFSFVMGIFNYLSTLMHASNQLVASEIIRNQCLRQNLGLVILDAKCHSDDSVVSSYHESSKSSRLTFLLYDWLLKGANHMLSVKKSQINEDIYLEFLSILYLFDRFLPVIPKFSSTIPFKPSDKGYSSDVSFAITQSIEMLSQGGSFEECFLILKLTERFIQNIYYLDFNKKLPYQLGGMIDSHPIELLYAGGNADLARSFKYDKISTWKAVNLLQSKGLIDLNQADIGLKWDMGSRITGATKRIFNKYERLLNKLNEQVPWTIANGKLGNSSLNLIWYINKLKDRGFYASLVDEPVARRYSRIFGSGNYRQILSKTGNRIDIAKVTVLLNELDSVPDLNSDPNDFYKEFLDIVCRDLYNFYDSLEGSEIINTTTSNLKEKPVVFRQGESLLGNLTISSSEFTSYVKEPLGYKLLGKRINPFREVDKIQSHLRMIGIDHESLSADQLDVVARRILREDSREYRLITPVKGDKRRIENYSDVIYLLSTNSYKHLIIEIRNKAAQVLDWNKKIIQGKIPNNVKSYIDLYWMCDILEEFKMFNYEIFDKNPRDDLQFLKKSISEDWLPIVNSSTPNPDLTLSELNFWTYWSKEQIKIAGRWYGSGICVINLPEIVCSLKVVNGVIEELDFESEKTGELSLASSWYLNVFFRFSGLHIEMVSSDFADPTKIYLGYKNKDSVFGIGRGKGFDSIILCSNKNYNLLPGFTFKELIPKKQNRNYIYHDPENMQDYKLSFFFPTTEPAKIDFKPYLNKDAIQKLCLKNNDIKIFVQKMAIKELGTIVTDKEALIDNISRSLIYHVCYDYSESMNVYRGDSEEKEPLLKAIMNWKKQHPEFGFPSEEELADYLKQKNIAPLPNKVYGMLIKLGHGRVTEAEFQNITLKILSLEGDDREKYLLSCFPFLSAEYKNSSITLIMKSKRIYNCCKRMLANGYRLVVPLVECIADCISEGNLYSSTLQGFKIRFDSLRGTVFQPSNIFKIIAGRTFMDSLNVDQCYSCENSNANILLQIVQELLDQGLLNLLGAVSEKDSILKTVEFQVDKKVFLDWFVDLLDCCFIEVIPKLRRYKKTQNTKLYFGENGLLNQDFGNLRSITFRMKLNFLPETLTLESRRKSKIVEEESKADSEGYIAAKKTKIQSLILKVCEGTPGVIGKFLPLTDEWQEEFEDGYAFDPNLESQCEFDKNKNLDRFAYCSRFLLDKITLMGLRGTAWNVFISCSMFDKSCWQAGGIKKLYKKINISSNPYEFFSDSNNFIFYVGNDNFRGDVIGYQELQFEQAVHIGVEGLIQNKKLIVEGKEYEKLEAIYIPKVVSQLGTVESYFKTLTVESMEKHYKEMESKFDFIEENLEVSDKFEKDRKLLHGLIKNYEIEKREKESKSKDQTSKTGKIDHKADHSKEMIILNAEGEIEEKDTNATNLKEIMNSMSDILNKIANLKDYLNKSEALKSKNKAVHNLELDYNNYKFNQTLELMEDMNFKAEFEAFFPGYWNLFINGELCITKQSLKTRLELARYRIDKMPSLMRQKYRKIYLIVSMFLNSLNINQRMDPKSLELGYLIDDIFDLEFESDEEQLTVTTDLLPDNIMDIPVDLRFL
jgi:hypothetical protein